LLVLRPLAQRLPKDLTLIALNNQIVKRFCFEQVFAGGVEKGQAFPFFRQDGAG